MVVFDGRDDVVEDALWEDDLSFGAGEEVCVEDLLGAGSQVCACDLVCWRVRVCRRAHIAAHETWSGRALGACAAAGRDVAIARSFVAAGTIGP